MCGRVSGAAGSLDCKSQTGLWEAAEIRPTARGAEVSRTSKSSHTCIHFGYSASVAVKWGVLEGSQTLKWFCGVISDAPQNFFFCSLLGRFPAVTTAPQRFTRFLSPSEDTWAKHRAAPSTHRTSLISSASSCTEQSTVGGEPDRTTFFSPTARTVHNRLNELDWIYLSDSYSLWCNSLPSLFLHKNVWI